MTEQLRVQEAEERKREIDQVKEEFIRYDNVNLAFSAAGVVELRKIAKALHKILSLQGVSDETPQPRKNKKQSSL